MNNGVYNFIICTYPFKQTIWMLNFANILHIFYIFIGGIKSNFQVTSHGWIKEFAFKWHKATFILIGILHVYHRVCLKVTYIMIYIDWYSCMISMNLPLNDINNDSY